MNSIDAAAYMMANFEKAKQMEDNRIDI
jgi:hypothetical protein